MSYIYTYDGTNPTTGLLINEVGEVFYYVKETLKQAGWTVVRSSDGRTVNTTSDMITNTGAVAGGTQNNYLWFVIKHPSSSRQILFYKKPVTNAGSGSNKTYTTIAVLYSYSSGFTGGTASSRPTATDEKKIVFDDSSGWNYEGVGFFPVNPWGDVAHNAYRLYIAADNVAPYGWYAFFAPEGGGNPIGMWMFDPLQPGSYNYSDNDPYVFYFPANGWSPAFIPSFDGNYPSQSVNPGFWLNGMGIESSQNTPPRAFIKKGLSGESWGYMPALCFYSGGSAVSIPGNLYPDQYTNFDSTFPIIYGKRFIAGTSGTFGYKGISSVAQWVGCNRATGDVLSISGPDSRDKIVCGNLALPWDGSIPKV